VPRTGTVAGENARKTPQQLWAYGRSRCILLAEPDDLERSSAKGETNTLTTTTSFAETQKPGRFEHEAVFYRGTEELVAAVVPFIRGGIAQGEPVLVALLPDRLAAVEAALGADATRVDFVDMAELGANPACIIPEWRRFLEDTAADGPVRGVGEPVWSGRRSAEIEEAVFHEALLNLAFDGGPAWRLMCPYDVSSLPGEVLEEARRSHPVVRGAAVGTTYAGHSHAHGRFTGPLRPAPEAAERFAFGPADLAGLRAVVTRLAEQAGLHRDKVDDLVLAAHELATNSVVHGGGEGVLQAWAEPDAFVVEVGDQGVIEDPLVGRDLLHEFAEHGRGIWMANQLCDLVQVRSGRTGTVVRLFAWL
jgi:anti-sigma regulatory factor (Ser/Thr protein kinase)